MNVNSLTHSRPALDQGRQPPPSMNTDAKLVFLLPKWYKRVHPMNVDAA